MAYDVNNIINVVGRVSGSGLGTSNFATAMLFVDDGDLDVGALAWAVNTHKEFSSASDILDYFDSDSEAYDAITMYFSVTPKPVSLKVWLCDRDNDTIIESLAKAEDATWFFWFDVTAESKANVAAQLLLQTWGNSAGKVYAGTTNEAAVIDSGSTVDTVSQMVGAGARYAFIEYHPDNKYAGLQTAALFARVNYSADNSAITAFGKRKPGLTALDLSNSVYATLKTKGAVFYTKVEAGGSIDNGRVLNPFSTSSYGETIADIVDTEAMVNAMTVALYNYLMGTTTKRPQTPQGQAGAIQAVAEICEQFYRNGFLGAREYTDLETGETKIAEHGYVILTKPEDIFNLSDADRAAHKLYPISARVFKAGAAFEISAIIDVE